MKWIFKGDKIETNEGLIVIDLSNLKTLPIKLIYDIVNLNNNNKGEEMIGSTGLIDHYLLNSNLCTQEEREDINEQIYIFQDSLV